MNALIRGSDFCDSCDSGSIFCDSRDLGYDFCDAADLGLDFVDFGLDFFVILMILVWI